MKTDSGHFVVSSYIFMDTILGQAVRCKSQWTSSLMGSKGRILAR